MNCLSVFDHFVGLELKTLIEDINNVSLKRIYANQLTSIPLKSSENRRFSDNFRRNRN